MTVAVTTFAVMFALVFAVWLKQNWARIVLLILFLVGLPALFFFRGMLAQQGVLSVAILFAQTVAQLVSLGYLFTQRSNAWFRRVETDSLLQSPAQAKRHTETALIAAGGIVLVVLAFVSGVWFVRDNLMSTIAESPVDIPLDAKGRFEKYDREYQAAEDDYHRWLARSDGVLWAVDALTPTEAREYAVELLAAAPRYRDDWNYGNAIHKGNLALGRLALRDGNIEQAKHYLLEAGKTPGSPQLDSFGPNMLLAKELLEKGDRTTVLEYLDLCGKFWSNRSGSIAIWKELIARGKRPNFAANLVY